MLLFMASSDSLIILFAIMVLLGGLSTPIYSQCISHVNDHLVPRQFVAASGTLLMLNGLGAACGPLIVTTLMQVFGHYGFAGLLAISFAITSIFGIYRAFRTDTIPLEDQGDAIIMPARGSGMEIYNED
jgi:MFS family permease